MSRIKNPVVKIPEILEDIDSLIKKLGMNLSFKLQEDETVNKQFSELQRLYKEFSQNVLEARIKKYELPSMSENETFNSRPYIEWVKNFANYMRNQGEFSLENKRPYESKFEDKVIKGTKFDVLLNKKLIGYLEFIDTNKTVG